ncbi:MAG: hypothetical protein M1818_002488, partial [Claussenomyces sp. TS43310]
MPDVKSARNPSTFVNCGKDYYPDLVNTAKPLEPSEYLKNHPAFRPAEDDDDDVDDEEEENVGLSPEASEAAVRERSGHARNLSQDSEDPLTWSPSEFAARVDGLANTLGGASISNKGKTISKDTEASSIWVQLKPGTRPGTVQFKPDESQALEKAVNEFIYHKSSKYWCYTGKKSGVRYCTAVDPSTINYIQSKAPSVGSVEVFLIPGKKAGRVRFDIEDGQHLEKFPSDFTYDE